MYRNLLISILISGLIHLAFFSIPNFELKPVKPVKTVITYSANKISIDKGKYNTELLNPSSEINKPSFKAYNTINSKTTHRKDNDNLTSIQNSSFHKSTLKTYDSPNNASLISKNDLKQNIKSTGTNQKESNYSDSPITSNNSSKSDDSATNISGDQTETNDNNSGNSSNQGSTSSSNIEKEESIHDNKNPEPVNTNSSNNNNGDDKEQASESLKIKRQKSAINSFTSAVNRACNAAKHYPPALQAQKISGRVTLILTFSASGLSSVMVSTSSGNSELDQAALRAVNQARIPEPPHELSSKLPIRVRISLNFKLN